MSLDPILAWSAAIVGMGAAVTVLWKLLRWLASRAKMIDTFLEDWNGTPARPGVAAVPGVMARLDAQDVQVEGVSTRLKRVEWHTGNGDPEPMRAVVEETRATVAKHTIAIDDILGVIGTRRADGKRPPLARPKRPVKGTVKT